MIDEGTGAKHWQPTPEFNTPNKKADSNFMQKRNMN